VGGGGGRGSPLGFLPVTAVLKNTFR